MRQLLLPALKQIPKSFRERFLEILIKETSTNKWLNKILTDLLQNGLNFIPSSPFVSKVLAEGGVDPERNSPPIPLVFLNTNTLKDPIFKDVWADTLGNLVRHELTHARDLFAIKALNHTRMATVEVDWRRCLQIANKLYEQLSCIKHYSVDINALNKLRDLLYPTGRLLVTIKDLPTAQVESDLQKVGSLKYVNRNITEYIVNGWLTAAQRTKQDNAPPIWEITFNPNVVKKLFNNTRKTRLAADINEIQIKQTVFSSFDPSMIKSYTNLSEQEGQTLDALFLMALEIVTNIPYDPLCSPVLDECLHLTPNQNCFSQFISCQERDPLKRIYSSTEITASINARFSPLLSSARIESLCDTSSPQEANYHHQEQALTPAPQENQVAVDISSRKTEVETIEVETNANHPLSAKKSAWISPLLTFSFSMGYGVVEQSTKLCCRPDNHPQYGLMTTTLYVASTGFLTYMLSTPEEADFFMQIVTPAMLNLLIQSLNHVKKLPWVKSALTAGMFGIQLKVNGLQEVATSLASGVAGSIVGKWMTNQLSQFQKR